MRARLAILLLVSAMPLRAQCPDGSPPPCAGAQRPAARRPVPDSAARARTFILLPFRNVARSEAQEWLVDGSPLMLADALGQYRDLAVVPDEQLLAARRRLGLAAGAVPEPAQLRRLAEETGGWTAVSGTIIATGGRVRFGAQALDARTGRVLARASANMAADADVRTAFDSLATQLLGVAGVEGQAPDLAGRSTRSLDAYRAYARGIALARQSAFRRAAAAFTEAVRHDSTFALGWANLALMSAAWNIGALMNPLSPAYRASERAVTLAGRLPPLLNAMVRAQSAFFRGELPRARELADSLLAAEPEQLDVREFRASLDLIDPTMDTTVSPPRMRANPNEVVRSVRRNLELDPGRRHLYSTLGYTYGTAGGLWGGTRAGTRSIGGSFAMLMLTARENFVPVLRDTFEVMPEAAFRALPAAEQAALRRRAADAGAQWMQRWIAAGPEDAEAYLWASRFAELQDSLPQALRYAERAEALGVESELEDVRGRRVMLLMRTGRTADAGALADSMAAAGTLKVPLVALIDRGYAFGVAALLATGRLARVGDVAPNAAGDAGCRLLAGMFTPNTAAPLPENIVAAVRDSIGRHIEDIGSRPVLQACLRRIASP